LLFAGTEQGVYVSFDDGAHGQPLQLNLPAVPVNDLIVKNNDLVVATHGRSFWILDDISPLRQYNESIPQQDAHLFTPAATSETVFRPSFFAAQSNVGKNPPGGAVVYYWLKTSLKSEKKEAAGSSSDESQTKTEADKSTQEKNEAPRITLEVRDSSGKTVRKFPKKEEPADDEEDFFNRDRSSSDLPADAGLNRFVWDLRYEGATKVPHAPLWGGNTNGPVALPGTYQVRLKVLGKTYTAPLEITADPRLAISSADMAKRFDLLLKIRDAVTSTDDTIIQIRDLREQINTVNKHLGNDPREKAIADAGKALNKKMTEVEDVLIQTKAKSGQDVLNFPVRLNNHLVALGGVVGSADTAPTQQSYEVFDMLSKELNAQLAKWKEIVSSDIPAYNNLVKQQDVPAIRVTQPEAAKF
jgi:hypothetical protein